MKTKILLLGGSGGLSGCLARTMLERNMEVWTVTRSTQKLPLGVHPILADRNREAELEVKLQKEDVRFDAAIDCICMTKAHAEWDLKILPEYTKRLAVVSTDSVYDPRRKAVPQGEESDWYVEDEGYAGDKRKMEKVFLSDRESLRWTLFRPGHIYGPGFLLGCYPNHSREAGLLERIRADKPLFLAGGGHHLTQPVFVQDLADSILDCLDKPKAFGEIFCIGGPKAVENRRYYEIIGEVTGHPVQIKEVPLEGFLEAHPKYSGHLCERSYTLDKLKRAGIRLPATSLEDGIAAHAAWLDSLDS